MPGSQALFAQLGALPCGRVAAGDMMAGLVQASQALLALPGARKRGRRVFEGVSLKTIRLLSG